MIGRFEKYFPVMCMYVSWIPHKCSHINAFYERTSKEEKIKLRVGSSDLLDYLLELNKTKDVEEEYTFAMGADTFMDLTSYKWKRSKDVVSMIEGRFVVKLRESDNSMITKASITERIKQVEKDFKKENISFKLDVHLNTEGVSSVSSSAARETRDEKVLSSLLNADVVEYIKTNELYKFAKTDTKYLSGEKQFWENSGDAKYD